MRESLVIGHAGDNKIKLAAIQAAMGRTTIEPNRLAGATVVPIDREQDWPSRVGGLPDLQLQATERAAAVLEMNPDVDVGIRVEMGVMSWWIGSNRSYNTRRLGMAAVCIRDREDNVGVSMTNGVALHSFIAGRSTPADSADAAAALMLVGGQGLSEGLPVVVDPSEPSSITEARAARFISAAILGAMEDYCTRAQRA